MISTVTLEPLFHLHNIETPIHRSKLKQFKKPFFLTSSSNLIKFNASFTLYHPHMPLSSALSPSNTDTSIDHSLHCSDTFFSNTFTINTTQMVEGKVFVRLDQGKDVRNWELTVGCNLPGKWILHWGVTHVNDNGREWDQPHGDMLPPGSVPIKDYAIETPLKDLSLSAEDDTFHEIRIDLKPNDHISAINFVLKDEETGAWYRNKGRDFKVPLINYLKTETNTIEPKRGLTLWPGFSKHSSFEKWILFFFLMLFKSRAGQDDSSESIDPKQENDQLEGYNVEIPITKKVLINNFISVSVKKYFESEEVKNLLYLETDLPGDVALHWGVCRDDSRKWEVPPAPHPSETVKFKDKALRTQFKPRGNGQGSSVQITLGEEFSGFLFVLKQNENAWFKYKGNDFYIPLSSSSNLLINGIGEYESEGVKKEITEEAIQKTSFFQFTNGTVNEIKNVVAENSSESGKVKSKEVQNSILQEIERLASEAYNFFRSSIPTFSEATTVEHRETTIVEREAAIVEPEATVQSEKLTHDIKICSATGSGYEIICQGFNWESHKSGRWYMELKEKASELSSLGFTLVWLPPPTESVSPEGYMPKDLFNLNSRYGNIGELKDLVKRFHEVGIKVLGDAVLNHRCAHYQNQNGIWNIFGGRLNWDDRAVVADDPHFQGRGNKSSGDNFHAAPNIDHSQEFVRKDLKEWLCWLRKEVGYDGWRLDFVRGFWGGYVKDYLDASEPYFAVGEYWDSLGYSYGEMDYNQDAHRQRIIDWIRATSGTASAFDVTTKGILHSALEKCEYWRLSDQEGKPPGVVGWWPSRAVTFIENHDTGSTQGHWRFPSGKEMQGYAYILTHPGTPSVFFDHILSHYKTEIEALVSIRKRNKIHCRSTVEISKAERDVYAAIIDEKIAMKIGPGHFEPSSTFHKWSLAIDGKDYKIWEASS
ncbi:alpha-amylase 3, chloroplastic isoform X2 [Cicer arietinum]|uniref:alpha-amylase n=1 Tax=Cicer arietinum TaxID=3827 RepID=A0A1S2XLB7_CICAR|nr:alpha-amylase 3, chloroplastic isoform X1 [Cicer arietinum]